VKNEGLEEVVKVTWNVVVKGWRGVFTLMDCVGKMGFVAGGEEWFSQELPAPRDVNGAGIERMVLYHSLPHSPLREDFFLHLIPAGRFLPPSSSPQYQQISTDIKN
jgi:hypothetical protein